jgi:DNA-binding LacI/PurR family transcriptional regulator
MRQFLKKKTEFTALVACNDFSAIGAVLSLREAVSVAGFDDINSAAYQIQAPPPFVSRSTR